MSNTRLICIRIPNVTRFALRKLYSDDLSSLIDDLEREVLAESGVKLLSSNPDFVLVGKAEMALINLPRPIVAPSPAILSEIDIAYQSLVGKCTFDDIEGYAGVKFSLRPDRRLQVPHEGSLLKALYIHLQTRKWIKRPKGLKYYVLSETISNADRKSLRTLATHSITTVQSRAESAVDEVFSVTDLKAAHEAFTIIQS